MKWKQTGAYLLELQLRMVQTVNMHRLQAVNHQALQNVVLNHLHTTVLYD